MQEKPLVQLPITLDTLPLISPHMDDLSDEESRAARARGMRVQLSDLPVTTQMDLLPGINKVIERAISHIREGRCFCCSTRMPGDDLVDYYGEHTVPRGWTAFAPPVWTRVALPELLQCPDCNLKGIVPSMECSRD